MSRFASRSSRRWTREELDKTVGRMYGKPAPIMERPNRRDVVHLVIPFPPTTNHDKVPNGHGGQLLAPETEAFRSNVSAIVMAQRAPWVRGPYTVAIALYPPDRRAYDIDNRIKPTLDALQAAGVLENDRHVKRIVVEEVAIHAEGQAIVTVESRSA